MSTTFDLIATKRTETGKGPNRRLRNAGQIPAVLYGRGLEPMSLAVDPKLLATAISGPLKMNTMLQLDIQDGGKSIDKQTAVLRDFQIHPLKRSWLHADFALIRLDEELSIRVPIELTGRAQGVVDGGLIQIIRRDIGVRCLPANIPTVIQVDVTALKIGDNIHVRDVQLPAGVTAEDSGVYTILTCAAPAAEKSAADAAAEAAAVEGAAAAPAAEVKKEEPKK